MTSSFDIAIIGGGHQGLIAAAALARRGYSVVLCEQHGEAGGLTAAYREDTSTLDPRVIDRLRLRDHGLTTQDPPAIHVPRRGEHPLVISADAEVTASSMRRINQHDGDQYRAWRAHVDALVPMIRRWFRDPAPDAAAPTVGDALRLGSTGIQLRRLGRERMHDLLRIAPMCLADWLNEWFDDDFIKNALMAPGLEYAWIGPWSPGGVFNLLRAAALQGEAVFGGATTLIGALISAARSAGATIQTKCAVKSITIDGRIITGLQLTSGEQVTARAVITTIDPQQVVRHLLPPQALPADIARRVHQVRSRGCAAVMQMTLHRPIGPAQRLRVMPASIDELERSFDAVKYGRSAENLWLEATVDDEQVTVWARYVDADGDGDDLGRQVTEQLAQHLPDLPGAVDTTTVLTPRRIESRFGITGGHLAHGEHAIDQLLLRPTPDLMTGLTPLDGLYLAGRGVHGGGGVTGSAALHVADAVAARL